MVVAATQPRQQVFPHLAVSIPMGPVTLQAPAALLQAVTLQAHPASAVELQAHHASAVALSEALLFYRCHTLCSELVLPLPRHLHAGCPALTTVAVQACPALLQAVELHELRRCRRLQLWLCRPP